MDFCKDFVLYLKKQLGVPQFNRTHFRTHFYFLSPKYSIFKHKKRKQNACNLNEISIAATIIRGSNPSPATILSDQNRYTHPKPLRNQGFQRFYALFFKACFIDTQGHLRVLWWLYALGYFVLCLRAWSIANLIKKRGFPTGKPLFFKITATVRLHPRTFCGYRRPRGRPAPRQYAPCR